MDENYKTPMISWLKVTDYMHGWMQHALGGAVRIREQRVLSVQHLPGAKGILRMETTEDMLERKPIVNAMSGTRKNCICAGLDLDASVMERMYGMTKELLLQFVPIECPKMCLTKNGVLRPWTLDVCFGKKQATALQKLLRQEFWNAVEEFSMSYAKQHVGEKYPDRDMIERFCLETDTSDMYVDDIRREWQRRIKREDHK